MIYYDFECKKGLDLVFGERAHSLARIYRCYKQFTRKTNSVHHQKESGCSPTAVTKKNVAAFKKKTIQEDYKESYVIIQHQVKIRSSAINRIRQKKLSVVLCKLSFLIFRNNLP